MRTRIFVGNLSFDASEQDLRDVFAGNGRQVESVRVFSCPRGFAIVVMATELDTAAAIAALDGQELHGRDLRVKQAYDKPRRDSGRSRGRF